MRVKLRDDLGLMWLRNEALRLRGKAARAERAYTGYLAPRMAKVAAGYRGAAEVLESAALAIEKDIGEAGEVLRVDA